MKRVSFVLLIISLLQALSACTPVEVHGIENFRKQTCSVSLTEYLFPSDDFLSRFKYEKGDYQYCDTGDIGWGYVTTLGYLSYPPDEYRKAKDFCLDQFSLCENHQYEYGGYYFAEILCHKSKDDSGDMSVVCLYPKHFNMFAYNDQNYTLVFLGYYNGDPDDPDKALAETDFNSFFDVTYAD